MGEFKDMDRKSLLQSELQQLQTDIDSGAALQDPQILNRFVLVSFADLKTHRFMFWFAFPALVSTNLTYVHLMPPQPFAQQSAARKLAVELATFLFPATAGYVCLRQRGPHLFAKISTAHSALVCCTLRYACVITIVVYHMHIGYAAMAGESIGHESPSLPSPSSSGVCCHCQS